MDKMSSNVLKLFLTKVERSAHTHTHKLTQQREAAGQLTSVQRFINDDTPSKTTSVTVCVCVKD